MEIAKVLLPNIVNNGYDYRLTAPASVGTFVRATAANKEYIGVIIGPGDGVVDAKKIKDATPVGDWRLTTDDLRWIRRMSEWTLMPMGAVLKLIVNVTCSKSIMNNIEEK